MCLLLYLSQQGGGQEVIRLRGPDQSPSAAHAAYRPTPMLILLKDQHSLQTRQRNGRVTLRQ